MCPRSLRMVCTSLSALFNQLQYIDNFYLFLAKSPECGHWVWLHIKNMPTWPTDCKKSQSRFNYGFHGSKVCCAYIGSSWFQRENIHTALIHSPCPCLDFQDLLLVRFLVMRHILTFMLFSDCILYLEHIADWYELTFWVLSSPSTISPGYHH